jgi:hypothetical protein
MIRVIIEAARTQPLLGLVFLPEAKAAIQAIIISKVLVSVKS